MSAPSRPSAARPRSLLRTLGGDGHRLFATRVVRLFAYGFLSVVLVLYLVEAGLSEARIGLLLTLTLLGDTAVSLWLTTHADRFGRRRTLLAGAALMLFAGVVFALTGNFLLLLVAATVGVVSPSGNEVGPFLAVEQAALTQVVSGGDRTRAFAWYGLVGSFATAAGSLAGGFVVQSLVAYWFHRRFGVAPATLGGIFFGANLLAGISALVAVRVAGRIGLVNTMVVTHLPSNLLLILVPLMPTLPLAIAVLFLRFSISQMDVPTRQSYTMAVVSPDERSAAAGVTGVARTTGAALSPVIAGPLFASPALMGVPFFLAGGLKIVYDLLLWRSFRALKPPEEGRRAD